MTLSPRQIKHFQKHILSWYAANKRDLPWRQTRDPYKILVSEVMSQQTQISRVVPKYTQWLLAFPTVQDLAKASVRDVLLYWSGLGYNRRALYLHRLAKELVEQYNGVFPKEETILLTLPGIGTYTARALLCFAFDQQVAVIDTNVRKVILVKLYQNHPERSVGSCQDSGQARMTEKEIEKLATLLLPKGKAYEWNQALMDYAAAELKHEKIQIPKQPRFKGSDRYVRGQVLKLLLRMHSASFDALHREISQTMTLERERFAVILKRLASEGLVIEKDGLLTLL